MSKQSEAPPFATRHRTHPAAARIAAVRFSSAAVIGLGARGARRRGLRRDERASHEIALALPTGIKKLTNIAVVRLKKAGVRFEIACYKNTVVAWRDKFERDIDNVLQTTQVYNNVSKGIFAKEEDLLKAFGTTDEAKICALILEAGELQVSEKERKQNFENIFRDAVTVLVDKCVNPETNRPYPPGMIERALKEIHFSVDPMKSAKQQALAALPKLQTVFPIKRARDALQAHRRPEHVPATLAMLADQRATVETRTTTEIVCTAEPSAYRTCDKHVREATGGTGRFEVVTMAVTEGAGPPSAFDSHEATPGATRGNPGAVADTLASVSIAADRDASSTVPERQRASRPAVVPRRRGDGGVRRGDDGQVAAAGKGVEVLYARGPIAAMPEEYASRRDRFAPLDGLQEGWTVELRRRVGGSVVDAVFFGPDGVGYKAFADARREALRASKGG